MELLPDDAPIRIGLCRTDMWEDAEKATRDAVEDAARSLEKAGFSLRDVALPSPCEDLPETREIINDFERGHSLVWEWMTHGEKISAALTKSIRRGLAMPRARYVEALERVALCRTRAAGMFTDIDVLLTPAADGEAPLGLAQTGPHRFQSIWTQLRTPSVTLPTYAGPNGMPVGIQLIGACYADDRLMAIAQRMSALLGSGPKIEL